MLLAEPGEYGLGRLTACFVPIDLLHPPSEFGVPGGLHIGILALIQGVNEHVGQLCTLIRWKLQ